MPEPRPLFRDERLLAELRRLHQLFGEQLADSESRFELEVALRARALLDPPL